MPNCADDIVIFLDLDDTLFRSRRRAEAAGEPLGVPATVDREGVYHSYMSEAQATLLSMLGAQARIIPTTARTSAAYSRVQLDFRDYAICSAGSVILNPQGQEDEAWASATTETRLTQDRWIDLSHRLEETCPELEVKPVVDFEQIRYVSIRGEEDVLRAAAPLIASIAPKELLVSPHSRDILIRDRSVGKESAMRWVLENRVRKPPKLILGAGDRLDDVPFLKQASFMIVPSNSQIAEHLPS